MMIYAVVCMKKEDYKESVLLFGEKETLRSDFNWKYSKYLFFEHKSSAKYCCAMLNEQAFETEVYTIKEICIS